MTEEEVRSAIDLIKNSGLFHKMGERKVIKDTYVTREELGAPEITKPRETESLQTFVANSQEQLEALAKVWGTKDEEAIGLALGFPMSAVEAYVHKRSDCTCMICQKRRETRKSKNFSPRCYPKITIRKRLRKVKNERHSSKKSVRKYMKS